jgi:alkylresorcinol/alkylpyrone synthase
MEEPRLINRLFVNCCV